MREETPPTPWPMPVSDADPFVNEQVIGVSIAEDAARKANSAAHWDDVWRDEKRMAWREEAMADVYGRIASLVPMGAKVLDIGGGVGMLARQLIEERECDVELWEHNDAALAAAAEVGATVKKVDLLQWEGEDLSRFDLVVATELLEHLDRFALDLVLKSALTAKFALFSVPNYRLGPDEEPEHVWKWTALQFLETLRLYWGPKVRVEPDPNFLVGVCGSDKVQTISMTLPVKDEQGTIEKVLGTFRGIADEIVVGVDPRSTDRTEEIARRYAEKVFILGDPRGPEGEQAPEDGVHFSHIRNQCIDRCECDWIFMTEGHEWLAAGQDFLLQLDAILPKGIEVCLVTRSGKYQQWQYPWLFRNNGKYRFTRMVHNILDLPKGTNCIYLEEIRTYHEAHLSNRQARAQQRRIQNRKKLTEDWILRENVNSLHYLGSEWRQWNPDKAIGYLEELLRNPKSKNGAQRYQTRLLLSRLYGDQEDFASAKKCLLRCVEDDWSRTEHWMWLGDLCFDAGDFEEALQHYRCAATRLNKPPLSLWWIDIDTYTYLPAQRLAMTYARVERMEDALEWAEKVLELLPEDAPQEMVDECTANRDALVELVAEGRMPSRSVVQIAG